MEAISLPQFRLIHVQAERILSGCPVSTATQATPSMVIAAKSTQCSIALQPRFL